MISRNENSTINHTVGMVLFDGVLLIGSRYFRALRDSPNILFMTLRHDFSKS
jgi:hypothetical protein